MLDITSKQIHETAIAKAAKYLVAEAELLTAIMDVDRHQLYKKFDETHLTPYCVKYLKLSEDVAAMFVRVARKSQQVPELGLAVQDGLQMSKAKTIASVIDSENQQEWIEKAQTLTKDKLEREVAAANPSAPKPEKAKPTGPNRIRIEFEVTYEEAEMIKRARELMSQKKSKYAQIGETLVAAARDWVDREDPVRKAERAQKRKDKNQNREMGEHNPQSKRKEHGPSERTGDAGGAPGHDRPRDRSNMPADIIHQVNLRDRGACRKRMPDGSICGCRQWTDIHHIVPRSMGGEDTVENLITLCKAHHRQLHERSA